MNRPASAPVVNFDNFNFPATGFNQSVAADISLIFTSYTSQDHIQYTTEFESEDWSTTIGSGGSGMSSNCMTQSHQRAIIASAFADYSTFRHTSLFLGLPEYLALKNLYEDVSDGDWGNEFNPHKDKAIKKQLNLLQTSIIEFEKAYVLEDPGFIFTLIKTTTNE